MGELALVKSADFGAVTIDLYRDDRDMWLTRDQIGTALEYKDPRVALAKIHDRHKDRLDRFSGVTKVVTPGGQQETVVYSPRGVYEICRWSQQPKANAFFDWVYDLLEGLRTGNLTVTPAEQPAVVDLAAQQRLAEAQLLNAKTRQARELRLMMQASRDWLPEAALRQMAQDAARLLAPESAVPERPSPTRRSRRVAARSETPSLVARNIRFWRVERRLAIRDLCARIHVDYTRLAEWETGKRTIPAPMVGVIAEALQVDPKRFFEEPPTKHGGEIDR